MGILAERILTQLRNLQAERDRIQQQATANLRATDDRIAALTQASRALTPEVERAYEGLVRMGIIDEVQAR